MPGIEEYPLQKTRTRWAKVPFYFNSTEHLLRIERERATTLGELLEGVKKCSEEAIFQHTFRTLQEHHFIPQGYSNDFAHWAFFACHENRLAEQLGGIDMREFISLPSLRQRIVEILEEYLASFPTGKDRVALAPFCFCSSVMVVVPTAYVARNLREFAEAMEKISVHSIHHHFIEARLRLKLNYNDFSLWLKEQMGLKHTAELINRIDIYASTLEGVRQRILRTIETALA